MLDAVPVYASLLSADVGDVFSGNIPQGAACVWSTYVLLHGCCVCDARVLCGCGVQSDSLSDVCVMCAGRQHAALVGFPSLSDFRWHVLTI